MCERIGHTFGWVCRQYSFFLACKMINEHWIQKYNIAFDYSVVSFAHRHLARYSRYVIDRQRMMVDRDSVTFWLVSAYSLCYVIGVGILLDVLKLVKSPDIGVIVAGSDDFQVFVLRSVSDSNGEPRHRQGVQLGNEKANNARFLTSKYK